MPPTWRLYRQLNHPTIIKHFPQGLLWNKYLWKMRENGLLNHMSPIWRFNRHLNHLTTIKHLPEGLFWTKDLCKMREYRLLNHLPLRWRLYQLLNQPPREHPVTNRQSAETPGTRQYIWQMREMRVNLTLYHPQKSMLNKPEE